jgi:glutamate--cysteine ligase
LQEGVARGITPADELLEKFHGPWSGSVEPVFTEYAY